MSKSIADAYTPSGHFDASLNCGVVTVKIRNSAGEAVSVDMSLTAWREMIEQSRAKLSETICAS